MKEHYTATLCADGGCRITTGLPGSNRIYWSKAAYGFTDDNEFPAFEGETVAANPLGKKRCYYHLFSDAGGYSVVAPRLLFDDGRTNARDLGGYDTADGAHFVKYGVLYRSSELAALDGEQLAVIQKLGLNTIVDFRQPYEIAARPDPGIRGAAHLNLLPLAADTDAKHVAITQEYIRSLRDDTVQEGYDYLENLYKTIALNNAGYRQFFRLLLDENPPPLLFHCVAGKDRTGIAAALILLALGVPRETVEADYMATLYARRRTVEKYRAILNETLSPENAERVSTGIYGVQQQSFAYFMDSIEERYPVLQDYFSAELGLDENDTEKLRGRFLLPHKM